MGFASDEQRKAVMVKLREAGEAGTANPRIRRRRPSTPQYKGIDPADYRWRSDREVARGDTQLKAGDWSAACFHYHQAAEHACMEAGAIGRHNLAKLLKTINAPDTVVQQGRRLNKFYTGDRYPNRIDASTGKEIKAQRIRYTEQVAKQAREDMQVVIKWCRGKVE